MWHDHSRDRWRQVRNVYLNWKGKYSCKDEMTNIMVLDLTGVSGSLVFVGVVGVSRSAMMTSSLSQDMSFSTRVLYTAVLSSQMPHSTERGGDLTTLGPRGWTLRTLEEVHDGVDVGLVEDEHDGDGGRGGS